MINFALKGSSHVGFFQTVNRVLSIIIPVWAFHFLFLRISRISNCYGLFDYWHRSDKFSQFCVFLVRACVRKWISKSAGFLWTWPWPWFWAHFQPRRWSGKESKSVFDFLNIGFHFLMRKLCISTDRMSSHTKLMWKVTLITLFHLALSKYFLRNDF